MIFEPRNRLSSKALKVWKIHGAMITILFWLFLIGASLLIVYQQWPVWLIGAGLLIGLLQLYLSIFFLPAIKWKRWRYEIREQEIDLQRGVWMVKRTLIPMVRVQHVDTEQGPILRRFKLSSIKISTAATIHIIPAIEVEEAEKMRQTISALARVAEEDV